MSNDLFRNGDVSAYMSRIRVPFRRQCQEQRSLSQNRKIARRLLTDKLDVLLNGKDSKVGRKIAKAKKQSNRRRRRRAAKQALTGSEDDGDVDDEDEQDDTRNNEADMARPQVT